MCGIVGCILKKDDAYVSNILFDCISKLEFNTGTVKTRRSTSLSTIRGPETF